MADPITIADYTTGVPNGEGIFDKMMTAVQKLIAVEYDAGRISGANYATVYLGAMQTTQATALEFLQTRDKIEHEVENLEQLNLNLIQEGLRITAETTLITAQELKVDAEKLLVDAQELLVDQQTLKEVEATARLVQETLNLVSEELRIDAETCKLEAEFDVLVLQKLKVTAETGLLDQRKVSEQAQTNDAGVTDGSVLGKQMNLYQAQTDGFARDAEQKASKIIVDTWNVRRTTDEATEANATNKLTDVDIGAVITKLKSGIGV